MVTLRATSKAMSGKDSFPLAACASLRIRLMSHDCLLYNNINGSTNWLYYSKCVSDFLGLTCGGNEVHGDWK